MIKISAIFNQSAPGIWDDFARIQGAAVSANYDITWTDELHNKTISDYERQFRGKTKSFAFGAYDAGSLVGFIRGDISRSEMKIDGLYVLPDYQNMKIGGQLLKAGERAGSLATKSVNLISMPLAERFYQRNGYRKLYSNVYDKMIPHGGYPGVVPAFTLSAPLARITKDMLMPYDISIKKYQPVLVYISVDFNILGVATTKSDSFGRASAVIVSRAPSNMKNMVERELNLAIAPFADR